MSVNYHLTKKRNEEECCKNYVKGFWDGVILTTIFMVGGFVGILAMNII